MINADAKALTLAGLERRNGMYEGKPANSASVPSQWQLAVVSLAYSHQCLEIVTLKIIKKPATPNSPSTVLTATI